MGNSIACRARWNSTKHARRTAQAHHDGRTIKINSTPVGYYAAGGFNFWNDAYCAELRRLRTNAAAVSEAARIVAIANNTYTGI